MYVMRAVGMKELKNRLAEYVRLAAAGEVVLVADRDRVVAQITAPDRTRVPTVSDAVLADAVRQGLIAPAAFPPGPLPDRTGSIPLATVLTDLATDREDR